MSNASGVFVVDGSRLKLTEQEAASISAAIVRAVMAEIGKLDRTRARDVDLNVLVDPLVDPLAASRGIGGTAGFVVSD